MRTVLERGDGTFKVQVDIDFDDIWWDSRHVKKVVVKTTRWPPNKQTDQVGSDMVPCRVDELVRGDFVKVGGLLKEVHAMFGGSGVETVDARLYSEPKLQGCFKRTKKTP